MASCGRGNLIDDIKGGDQSHGKKEKGKNNNKENNKQKGQTSSDPITGTPDTTKSEASTTSSDGKSKSKGKKDKPKKNTYIFYDNSVHPETSNTETETIDAPNKAASSPSPTPDEDVEECSEDQQKKPCGETPVTPFGNAGDDPALQQEEHGSTPSSGDTSTDYVNISLEETMDKDYERQNEMEDEIRRLKDELAKKEKEHQMSKLENEADIRSITEANDKLTFEKKGADEHVKQLLDKIEELHKINKTKDKEIEKLRVGIKAHEESALNIMKRIQEEANKNSRLESTVANLKDENSKHQKEKTRMDGELKNFKSQVSNQKTIMEDFQSTIKKIRKENEDSKQQCDKEYKKLKEEKEKNEKQFGKDRTKLTLRNSELEATLNNKNREHEAECKRLNETINQRAQQLNQYYAAYNKSVTEVSRLDADVQKLKLENHDLRTYKNIYPELKQQITSLEKQKEDLMLRLSKIAGANLTYNNPNIADLSDEKRPTKLAEEFSELYDNEWTDAFEEVEADDDKARTKFLFDVLKRASEYCTDLSIGHDAAIKSSFTTLKYEVTVPTTEESETAIDSSNDTSETATVEKVEKQENDKDTPNGATDSTTADNVEKQENDEGTPNDATKAVPMDNEDGQENDNTNNDLLSDNNPQKDDKQENKEDDDMDDATVAESNEATEAMNATTVSSKDEASLDENTEAQVGIEQGEASPKGKSGDISKTEDGQVLRSADTTEIESDENASTGDGTNEKAKDQTTKDGEEPKEITGANDEKLLNSQGKSTTQEGHEDVPPEKASDGACGDKVKTGGETTEDTKCGHVKDASSQKDGQTTQINNHEDKNDVENDDNSVDRPDNEDSSTMEGSNSTNDTKPKDEGAITDPPTNEKSETVYDTNGDALGTSDNKVETNSEQHDKNDEGAHGDGKETYEDVNTNSQSGENNESTTRSSRENKQPTTNTIEISKVDFNFNALTNEQLKMIMDLKKLLEIQQSEDVKAKGAKIIADAMNVSKESEEMMKYILKCIDICWSMHRHEPPVYINFPSHVDGQRFDKNVYRPYTKFGKQLDFVVWPSLHLHKDGPMLIKGVAQGK